MHFQKKEVLPQEVKQLARNYSSNNFLGLTGINEYADDHYFRTQLHK